MTEHNQPLELEEALRRIAGVVQPIQRQLALGVAESLGRVLAEPVTAAVSLPPFRASAMDGYAIADADWQAGHRSYELVGSSLAGRPFTGTVGSGEAARVFTGALVPDGADLVILQERTINQTDRVEFEEHTPHEMFVRGIGHDVAAGTELAARGHRINPFTIGILAAAGVTRVDVFDLPRVGVFSTGDELVDGGQPLAPGQIYDSNRVTVMQLLEDAPCAVTDLGRLPDEQNEVSRRLADAAQQFDLLLTSGGVSVGDADFITATVEELGELDFWRLNLKPGKPLAFGRIGECYLFGLPGNPVSTIVTLLLIAGPAIESLAGTVPSSPLRISAALASDLEHRPGRTEYQRGILSQTGGRLLVSHTGDQSSNRLQTFHGANCLIEVPGPSDNLPAGAEVTVLPFRGLL